MPHSELSAVTVRYFAGARAAAGVDEESVPLPAGASVTTLLVELGRRRPPLIEILERCSYLAGSVAVRDLDAPLPAGATVDVLPPFAGG
ncbi:MoaD/ThiS family protein [Tomitella biformata]|uniref:MoaD/ThiS family protein n=1 Tax=Tomitella biformata TaxID=630403 RepID=UPI0004BA7CAD|nr:MoaD/ThiS family protein [Tomitella biformata]